MQPISHIALVFNLVGSFKKVIQSEESKKYLRLGFSLVSFMSTKIKYFLLGLKQGFSKTDCEILVETPSASNLEGLLSEFRRKFSEMIFLSLSDSFLNWRVWHNPFRRYDFVNLYNHNCLVAYAIVDVTESSYELVDIGWQDEKYLDLFLFKIVSFYKRKNGCHTLSFWGNYTNVAIRRIFLGLKRMGGVKYRSGAWFVYKVLRGAISRGLNDLEKWYLTPIWFPTLYDR